LRVFLLLCLLLVSVDAKVLGNVVSSFGSVKIKRIGSVIKIKASNGMEVSSGDLVMTSKNSHVFIKLIDDSKIVLDSSSSVYFDKKNFISQSGKVFYKITSRDAKNSLKIKTPFAIIGIKGTTFIINNAKDSYVLLKDGIIGIQSIKEEFRLYRRMVQREFENFVSMQEQAFNEFKNAQNNYLPVHLTKRFDLKSGSRVSFETNRVNEDKMSSKDNDEFHYFEELIKK